MKKLLYQIRSLGLFKVILYVLLYPFRYVRGYLDWAQRVRSKKRSNSTIYTDGPESLIRNRSLSKERKKEIKSYYKNFGLSINTMWHEKIYAINGVDSNQYISEYHFYQFIEPHFNEMNMVRSFADKNLYSRHFPNTLQPKTILRSIYNKLYDESYQQIDEKTARERIRDLEKPVIIKPSILSGRGRNVQILKTNDDSIFLNDQTTSFHEILHFYKSGFIIQEIVNQHENLNAIFPDSLNTVKVISFRYQNEVHILSAFFRTGNDGLYMDSVHDGGFLCGIKTDGQLQKIAYDNDFIKHQKHPSTNKNFGDVCIPNFNKLKNVVRKLHGDSFYCDIASWDFGIDMNGEPVLIETNISSQGIFYHQIVSGPLFGEMTDTVLSDIF